MSLSITPGVGAFVQTGQTAEGHHVPWHASAVLDSTGAPFNLDACTVTYGRDGNGRVTSMSASNGVNTWIQTITRTPGGYIASSSPWVKQ